VSNCRSGLKRGREGGLYAVNEGRKRSLDLQDALSRGARSIPFGVALSQIGEKEARRGRRKKGGERREGREEPDSPRGFDESGSLDEPSEVLAYSRLYPRMRLESTQVTCSDCSLR